jgi:uncharacterized membrane protein YdjX (TVP38/TMEM64 family)
VPGLDEGYLMVHAKLAIVDDRWLRIGSSNLSNRSMGFDTECDLCVAASDDADRAAIAGLRRQLLAMFLAVAPATLAAAEARASGLIGAIDSLRGSQPDCDRTLVTLSPEVDPEWNRQLPDERLVDPDRPLSPVIVGAAMVGRRHLARVRRRLWLGGALVGILILLAIAWRWIGLDEFIEPLALATSLATVLHGTWGPVLFVGGFVLGSLIAVPVSLLIVVSALVYAPFPAALYALGGSLLAAAAAYGLGVYLGGPLVARLAGGRIHRLSERLAQRGILTIVAVRIIPVAPFTLINLLAGASHIRFRDFMIGTLIGMAPGIVAIAVFAQGLLALVREADLKGFLVAVLAFALIAAVIVLIRHLLSIREERHADG